jgi:hypothetical protein
VGYSLPAAWCGELLYAWAKARFTDEELELARRQKGGRSRAEIRADFEKA